MRTKSKQINFRVSEKDYAKIMQRVTQSNLNLTSYFLTLALDGKIIVVDGLGETITELNRIGNNLNQITRLFHQGIYPNGAEFLKLKSEVREVWRSLSSLTRKEV